MINIIKKRLTALLKSSSVMFFIVLSHLSHVNSQQNLAIGFGSCADQKRQQPIWDNIIKHQPDLFILMGDNVYIDSEDPQKMANAYKKLDNIAEFTHFKNKTPIIATWDDHDYAERDGGKSFVGKYDAKKAFLKYFDYAELNQTVEQEGIYHSRWLKLQNKKIQIIMLDTRWFRDPLVNSYLNKSQQRQLNLGGYQPTLDSKTTLLGEEQWKWLENELKMPADLKILVSSIQVLNEFSGWETWANFPHERIKLLNLLAKHTNNNLLILSGDVHRAEISTITYKNHSFVDVTSSGLAVNTYPAGVNNHRTGQALNQKNYGMLDIKFNDPSESQLSVTSTIYNDLGEQKLTIKLGMLNE